MKISSVLLFDNVGVYMHMLLMTIGVGMLLYMMLKINKPRIFYVTGTLALLPIIFSPTGFFYPIASIILVFISFSFIENYLEDKNTKTLLVAIAFLFLLAGNVHFIFLTNHEVFYVLGHFLELAAYILLLANFLMVLKK